MPRLTKRDYDELCADAKASLKRAEEAEQRCQALEKQLNECKGLLSQWLARHEQTEFGQLLSASEAYARGFATIRVGSTVWTHTGKDMG